LIKRKLYYFNPGHETAILNGSPYYMAPANVVTMQKDLAFLPAWIASHKDYVFLENDLPDCFNNYLIDNLAPVAKGITTTTLQKLQTHLSLHLWGISPQVIHFFEELNNKSNLNIKLPIWNNLLKQLSSRKTACDCLIDLCNNLSWLSPDIIPEFYTGLEDIELLVKKNNSISFLAKAPFSSSGRGLLWLPKSQLTRTEKQILTGILKKQHYVSIEKVLDKKLDFAMEFYISYNGDINFEGYSLFKTNEKGAYLGNLLDEQLELEKQICIYIDKDKLNEVKENLLSILKIKFNHIYIGCIGVDMMIYWEDGEYRLHPCVEINVRENMGLLAIKINRYLYPGSTGIFNIDFSPVPGEIKKRDINMNALYPARFSEGKITSGYLSLCPILEETKYQAFIYINKKTI